MDGIAEIARADGLKIVPLCSYAWRGCGGIRA